MISDVNAVFRIVGLVLAAILILVGGVKQRQAERRNDATGQLLAGQWMLYGLGIIIFAHVV